MPERRLVISNEFVEALSNISSTALLDRIHGLLQSIHEFPAIGSPNVRKSLVDRYGEGLRKMPVSTFVIVYRVTDDAIEILALVYGPSII